MSWKHFTIDEFLCRCGCEAGSVEMNHDLSDMLDKIRSTYYLHPLVITSGYRCPDHDKAVGRAANHSRGEAVDILVPKGVQTHEFLIASFALGIPRVILYRDKPHLHIDIVPEKPKGVFVL